MFGEGPAAAQVAATFSTPTEPDSRDLRKPDVQRPRISGVLRVNTSYGISAHDGCKKLTARDTTVAQNTEASGEKPHSMKAMIAISDRK